ncbi:MAG TPA: carboxypeptidase regulatory-like domain-containing protein [Longimicrobium sp.]|jgi:hypothetical protein
MTPRPLLLALAALLCAAAPAAAQAVQGRLVDAEGAPVERVLVALVDEAGAQRAAALTDAGGAFALRAPGAGRYRLRAERVGYATTTTEPFDLAAGETRNERLVAGGRPVALEGITVEAPSRRCAVRPEAGLQTATVWEEARKAINAAAFGQRERIFRYEVVQYERDLDPQSGRVEREERRTTGALAVHPFASPPAKELSEKGFVQQTPDGVTYYGPDPHVLLSDEFLADHCLRIAAERAAGDSLLGVAFEPVRGRRVPEIRGVLWLHRATAELRRVEYTYTGMPQAVSHERLGGTVEYERLPEGHWIVRRWAIRMPQVEVVQGVRTVPNDNNFLHAYENARLAAIREVGGEVARTATRAGAPVLAAAGGAAVEGTVWDSLAAAPLAGARVYLSGTQAAAVTDSAGRFRLEGPGAGSYTVAFSHPALGPLAAAARPAAVELAAGRTATVALAVPGWRTAAAALCPGGAGGEDAGVLAGTVQGAAAGAPVTVTAAWTRTVVDPRGERTELRTATARADERGFYVLCGVPEGRPFKLSAGTGSLASGEREVRLAPGAPLRQDLALTSAAEPVRVAAGADPRGAIPLPGVTGVGRREGFERRRATGRGIYLTRDDIERKRAVQTVDLFRGLPGVRIVEGIGGARVQMAGVTIPQVNDQALPPSDRQKEDMRLRQANGGEIPRGTPQGAMRDLADAGGNITGNSGMGECQVDYFLDGVPFQPAQEGRISDEIRPLDIEAVEIYRSAAETPAEFRRPGRSQCGVIVIWTRVGASRRASP